MTFCNKKYNNLYYILKNKANVLCTRTKNFLNDSDMFSYVCK